MFNNKTKPVKSLEDKEEKNKITAFVCAKFEVESKLKAPSTAKFQSYSKEVYKIDGYYIVKSYVDSQNSFGAMIRQNFICKIYKPNVGTGFCESEECAFE